MCSPVARQNKNSTKRGVINQRRKGSVCVGAATQTVWKSFAVDVAQPNLGGTYTSVLEQKMRSNASAKMPELVKNLTVSDMFERTYTIQKGDTKASIALKHRLPEWK